MIDTTAFCQDVAAWHRRMYAKAKPDDILHKLAEEVGELCGAYQKAKWATVPTIRDEWDAAERDAIGDIMIVLAAYCARRGYVLDDLTAATWQRVKARSRDRVLNGGT